MPPFIPISVSLDNLIASMTIKGTYTFDRTNDGILIPPSGSSFPTSPTTNELFYHTTYKVLYVYSDSAWVPVGSGVVRTWFDDRKLQAYALMSDFSIVFEHEFANYFAFYAGATGSTAEATFIGTPAIAGVSSFRLSSSAATDSAYYSTLVNGGTTGPLCFISNARTVKWLISGRVAVTTPNAYTRSILQLYNATDYSCVFFGIMGPIDSGAYYQFGVLNSDFTVKTNTASTKVPSAGTYVDFYIRNDGTNMYGSVDGETEINICASTNITSAPAYWLVQTTPATGASAKDSIDTDKLIICVGE